TTYLEDFRAALECDARIRVLPDQLTDAADIQAYQRADVIVGVRLDASMPRPERVRLFQVCATGYDRIERAGLPPGAALCNCYGRGPAIARYVMAAILTRPVPLVAAHARLTRGDWHYRSGTPSALRGEIEGATLGLLGYGHIGQAI